MPKYGEKKPKSFSEFINIIEEIQQKNNNQLWYRGCGKSNNSLIPSLYRHKTKKKIKELVELEYQLMTRFRLRSIPFHDRSLEDDWESLFFMQHYKVPTRLLDWTENPFIAFHFAVMSSDIKFKDNKLVFDHPAAIWILDPITWNRHALRHESFDQGILSTSDEQMKGYKATPKYTKMNKLPVALFGAHNSPRIVAQRGVFMIFGEGVSPMEKLYEKENFPQDSLVKITLNKSILPKMRATILSHGITESVVFPDLEGLAREIRREFEFEA